MYVTLWDEMGTCKKYILETINSLKMIFLLLFKEIYIFLLFRCSLISY